ncbi:hypothetical protein D3C80_1565970 [compost metagenome]
MHGRADMHRRHTTVAAQGQQRFRLAAERLDLGAVVFLQRLDEIAALGHTHRLALEVGPLGYARAFANQRRAAHLFIRRGHVIEDFSAFFGELHVGDEDVDFALLQELYAVRRQH